MEKERRHLMAISDKAFALEVVGRQPEDATLQDIMYALYVCAKIRRGLADIEASNTVSHEEMKREIAAWRESLGHNVLAESSGTLSGT